MNLAFFALTMSMNIKNYTQEISWDNPPIVVLCDNQSSFTQEQVEFALSAWNTPQEKIIVKDECNYRQKRGTIKIIDGLKINLSTQWGLTSYRFVNKKDKKILTSAIVQIDSRSQNINLLIHELGHAFGFSHYNDEEDVMNTQNVY
jgi:hypothetical protein